MFTKCYTWYYLCCLYWALPLLTIQWFMDISEWFRWYQLHKLSEDTSHTRQPHRNGRHHASRLAGKQYYWHFLTRRLLTFTLSYLFTFLAKDSNGIPRQRSTHRSQVSIYRCRRRLAAHPSGFDLNFFVQGFIFWLKFAIKSFEVPSCFLYGQGFGGRRVSQNNLAM